MSATSQRKRAGKRLLVAAMGVATVSYVGTQSGCAPDADGLDDPLGESSAPYDDEEEAETGGSQQALSISGAANVGNAVIAVPQPVGNLMPPPIFDPEIIIVKPPIIRPLPPVGNLMAPPIHPKDLVAPDVNERVTPQAFEGPVR